MLVGSQARGAATPESDVDLVVTTSSPELYACATSWALDLGRVECAGVEEYGPLVSVRVRYASGPEVEFGIIARAWAAFPLDPGTAEVVSSGMRALFEREPILTLLLSTGPPQQGPSEPGERRAGRRKGAVAAPGARARAG